MKNDRIKSVHLKFHIIPVILKFVMGLAIYNGEVKKTIFETIIVTGTYVFFLISLDLPAL